jgi:hypothetical protein
MLQSGAQRIAACTRILQLLIQLHFSSSIRLPCMKLVLRKYHMRRRSVRPQTMLCKT